MANSSYSPTLLTTAKYTVSIAAAGTAYSLTNAAALLDFGTTDPTITLAQDGTYLILARARMDYTGATFAAVRNVTLKLRRTNNTAADIVSTVFKTQIITALTFSAGSIALPPLIYTTANSDDAISFYGSIDTVPTLGTMDIVEAEIVAIKLY